MNVVRSAFNTVFQSSTKVNVSGNKETTVAVIGAGVGGLAAVKCALDEGLQPTCFEQDDQIGGTWYYTDHVRPNQGAAAYKELVANDGKEPMAYSDFPMPEKNAMNMPWQEHLQYLKDYAEHFGVTERIQFNTRVTKVTPATDYSDTGRWEVHVQQNNSSDTKVLEFDKVMVATGPFRSAIMPDIPGMKDFKGQMMHAAEYRQKDIFKGKRVMFVGGGIFAAEIASLSGEVADQTYLVLKPDGGFFVFPRRSKDNNNAFIMNLQRSTMLDRKWEENIPIFTEVARKYLDTDKYDLSPKLPFLHGGRFTVADSADNLVDQIETGKILIKRGLKHFTESGAVLEDGSEIADIDLVVFATGFGADLDIIDIPGIKGVRKRQDINLYLWEFPIDLRHDSLALIDFAPVHMPFTAMCELQSRLAARVFADKHKLPPRSVMKEWLEKQRHYFEENTDGKFMQLPILSADDVARELGVLPSFWRLFLRSPVMAHKVHYGPNLPVIYRFIGPGAQNSAWKEYDNSYRRGYEGGIPPPIPWGIHHYALASLLVGGAVASGWMFF